MRFSISSRSPGRLKSESLRTNEELVRLYNDVEESRRNLYFQRSRVLEDFGIYGISSDWGFGDREWQYLRERIRYIDYLMKTAEKNAQFREFLAQIVLQCEREFFHDLSTARICLKEDRNFMPVSWTSSHPDPRILLQDFVDIFGESVSSGLEAAPKLVVSALVLLSLVYQYLIGCVDKGGSKTYSPGSFLFRLIFVAIVLFLGSYVWIKFRQASFTASRRKRKLGDESDVPGGVYRRAMKDSRGEVKHYKYEPRFKPLREKTESGTPLSFNCLSLGSYNTRREAEIVRHIAVVLYGEEEGRPVQFEDGLCLPFPSVTVRENCPPSGKEKAVWVTQKTKELYAELLREKVRRLQLLHPAVETTGSHHGHGGEASGSDPFPSAPVAPSTAFELTCFTSPDGGNGVNEQSTTSQSQGVGQGAPVARELFSAFFSDCDFDEVIGSMLQREENDFPVMDQIEGDYSETDHVFGFESTSVPLQSCALGNPTSAIVASLPQLGVEDQGLEITQPQLNSVTAIHFQQLESLPEQVQLAQRVTCQETRSEEFSGSQVELQQKLIEYKAEISELQRKLLQSEVENEKWRSMFHRVAKLMSASNLVGYPVDIQ